MHFNDNHHILLDRLLHSKTTFLFLYQGILTFVKSMIGVFVPVYLYKLGYSIIEILLYQVGISLIYIFLIPIVIKILKRIGFKKTIFISTLIYLFHIYTLNYIETSLIYFNLSWILLGFYVAFFWLAMHSEIALSGNEKKRGDEIGNLQIIISIFTTFAYFIGGFFLDNFGYYKLFLFGSSLLIIASIILLFIDDIDLSNFNFNYRDYLNILRKYKNEKSHLAFVTEGIEGQLLIVIWPIIFFIIFKNSYTNLGMLFTFVSIISIILIIYFKKIIDNSKKEIILRKLSKTISFNWFLKGIVLFFSIPWVYIFESSFKILQKALFISYWSIYYNNAKKKNFMEYIILREFFLHSSKIFFVFLILIPYFYYFGESFIYLLIIAVLFSFVPLGYSFMRENT